MCRAVPSMARTDIWAWSSPVIWIAASCVCWWDSKSLQGCKSHFCLNWSSIGRITQSISIKKQSEESSFIGVLYDFSYICYIDSEWLLLPSSESDNLELLLTCSDFPLILENVESEDLFLDVFLDQVFVLGMDYLWYIICKDDVLPLLWLRHIR